MSTFLPRWLAERFRSSVEPPVNIAIKATDAEALGKLMRESAELRRKIINGGAMGTKPAPGDITADKLKAADYPDEKARYKTLTAYRFGRVAGNYEFGIEKALLIEALRDLADRIEADAAVMHDVTVAVQHERDEFAKTTLTLRLHEHVTPKAG